MDSLLTPLEFKFADNQPAGTFEGYGAVFGNVDSYGDVIQKGAFTDTLKEWKKAKRLPPMLVQHGGFGINAMDGLAIGKWEQMSEDETGLQVKGRLINLDTERGKSIYGAMKEGVLDGMSIGFRAKKFTMGTKPTEPRRKLESIDLIELSVVQMPANGKARVQAIKSVDFANIDIRELEAALRDEGLSRSDAVKAVSGLRSFLQRDAEVPVTDLRDEGAADQLAEAIRRNIHTLTAR